MPSKTDWLIGIAVGVAATLAATVTPRSPWSLLVGVLLLLAMVLAVRKTL